MIEKKVKTTENNGSTLAKGFARAARPVVFVITGALIFSFTLFKNNPFLKVTTIVIDAGHGGKDPGCSGSLSKEKEVTLAVALKLGKFIEQNLKDVKVIYTRKSDVFVELEERAMIANRNNADLFISIHCNAASHMETRTVNGKKKKIEVINTRPYGSETYVMGLKNEAGKANVVKRENSAMLLEDNYKEKYEGFDPNSEESYIIMSMWTETFVEQSGKFAANIQKEYRTKAGRIDKGVKRESLWVLWRTKMPSVLTEIGYLTNPEEEKFLASEKGQVSLAAGLFRAFRNYKTEIEGTNLKYNDEIENMEPVTNENIAKGDTSYMHEVEEYRNDADSADDPKEKLKQLYKDANQYFSVGDYSNAEKKYNEIKAVKEDDKTAKEKLAEIKKIRNNYKTMTDKADKLYAEKKYKEAKKIYGDAQVLMPKEKYPTQKIKDCETAIKGGTVIASESEFIVWIQKGDDLMRLQKFDEAMLAYKKALSLKPNDVTAKLKVSDCETAAKTNEKDVKYALLIAEGDKFFKEKNYSEAKKKYFEATLAKPEDAYPKSKIEELTKIMDEQSIAVNETKYSQLLNQGKNSMQANDFTKAKNSFSEALVIFPDRTEPKKKIAECDSFLNKMTEVKETLAKYENAIKKGDQAFDAQKWNDAKLAYEEALIIRKSDEYAKTRVAKCDEKLNELSSKQKLYGEAIKYGDDYMLAKDFMKAKESYKKALDLIPGDEKASGKITECDKLINAGTENIYMDEIAKADAFFLSKDFNAAIEHYKKASEVKPDEDYPKFQVRLSEKSLTWQKQNQEFKLLIDAAETAAKSNQNEDAIGKYKIAIDYIANAKENKTRFKPNTEELNKRVDDLNKLKDNKAVEPIVKSDTGSTSKKAVETSQNGSVQIKVQFTQSAKLLDTKSSKYAGIDNIGYYNMNGMYKYTAGVFYSVEEASVYRDKLKQNGYKDAFLVAFRNGERIDIKTAVELLSQKKNP